mgnify:CR=1 FL=1
MRRSILSLTAIATALVAGLAIEASAGVFRTAGADSTRLKLQVQEVLRTLRTEQLSSIPRDPRSKDSTVHRGLHWAERHLTQLRSLRELRRPVQHKLIRLPPPLHST